MKNEYQNPRVKVVVVDADSSIMNPISAGTDTPGEN